MVIRRLTFFHRFLFLITGVVCLPVISPGAPPKFVASLDVPAGDLSPFPEYNPQDSKIRFVSSLRPTTFIPLTDLGVRVPYEFDYDFPGQTVTYTRVLPREQKLIPVTSAFDNFVFQRLDISRRYLALSARRDYFGKRQEDREGGLFRFELPIRSRTFESIFGQGGAELKVSGYRKISFTGRSSWTDKPQTGLHRQSKFPTLQMEQVYQFDIEGTIGSKISVKVTQDSRNDIPLANRLILRYRGDEDDIIQSIEAGNTTLNLPSTRFLAYSTRVQGLFGLKASAQLADLSITAIASQEKGSTETVEITAGGSAAASMIVQDINYRKRTIYDLGRKPLIRSRSFRAREPQKYDFMPGDTIQKIIVYVDDNSRDDAERFSRQRGICYIDPTDTTSDDPLGVEFRTEGYFEVMEETEYYVDNRRQYIQFTRRALNTNELLAVYMEVWRAQNGRVDTIGSLGDTLRLKLIKPISYNLVNSHVWEYEWKNVYSLGRENIDLTELDIKIYRGNTQNNAVDPDDLDHQNGIQYLRILGLDQGDNTGQGAPDGELDRAVFVDEGLGLLFFPTRHPFDSRFALDPNGDSLVFIDTGAVPANLIALKDTVPEIYNNTQAGISQQSSKYYLAITTRGRGESDITLNASNIIEGSEVVTWNGQRLVRDKDYRIDTDFGRLTLLDEKYTDINSNLSITFESAPFFSMAKKTLLGTRLEYAPTREFNLGTTILYKSDRSTSRKPKVGEETSKALVWDVDFKYRFGNPVFHTLANVLPFYGASAESFTQVTAEVAQSRPNPNVDGQVYIDDFEGSRDSYSLGILRKTWRSASRPVTIIDSLSERGRIAWYNPVELEPIAEIYPNRDIGTGEQSGTNVLNIHFRPVDYRLSPGEQSGQPIIDTLPMDPENSWNGFMRNLPDGVVAQLSHAQLLEMRVRGDVGIMHIDLGRITEDIDGDGKLDNEDQDGFKVLDPEEDIGLDLLPDSLEYGYNPQESIFDPAGDNFNAGDLWRINGTEKNAEDPDGGFIPDTENPEYDSFEQVDGYFSYRVDLSDTSQFEVPGTRNPYNWRTLRIPLRDPLAIDTIIGEAKWDIISYARIWFDSASAEYVDSDFRVQIADIDLVSTTWGDSLFVADSIRSGPVSFDVAVINDEIDEGYTSPPGVGGYVDQARDITEAEQSLLLIYKNLNAKVMVFTPDSGFVLAADTGLAIRKFYRTSNFMGYGRLEAFVHGDDYVNDDSVMFFFRMGSDRNAYYEYRTILKPGWHADNHINIDFDRMTGLKAKLIEDYKEGADSSMIRVDETGKYLVKIASNKRDPSLTDIQYFAMGIINLDTTEAASGEVWIDELRLSDVRDDVGMAAQVSVSGNLSDLINYSFSYSSQDAYYRGISSATKGGAADNLGSGTTRANYAFSGGMRLEKFFPRSWGLTLPLDFNWSENGQTPLLRSGTDITIPKELRGEESSRTVSKGFGISQNVNRKTNNILFTALLNNLTTNFKYNISEGYSPTQPYFIRENYSTATNYNARLSKPPSLQLFKWLKYVKVPFGLANSRLYLLPIELSLQGNLTSSYSQSINQNSSNPTSSKRDFRGSLRTRFKVFEKLTGSYSFTTDRDLREPQTVRITLNPNKFKLGIEQKYSQSFSASYSPQLFNFLTHSVDYSASYGDTYRNTQNALPYHSASSKTTYGFKGSLNHQALLGTNKSKPGVRPAQKKSAIRSGLGIFITGVRYLSDAVEPVSWGYNTSRDLSFPGLSEKADMKFRFGFTESPGVEEINANTGTARLSKAIRRSMTAKSGLKLFAGITADLDYARSVGETFYTSPTITTNVKWPDVRLNVRQVRGLWILGKLLRAMAPSCAYSRSTDTRQRKNEPHPHEEIIKASWSPLLSFTINPMRSVRSTVRVESSNGTTNKINGTTGDITDITTRSDRNFGVGLNYQFTNPTGIKLPIFGRIRFTSQMSLAVDVSYRVNKTKSARQAGGYVFRITEDQTNLTIRPTASYSFSSTVKGGLSARWQDSNDVVSRTKRHTRELGLWVEMRF